MKVFLTNKRVKCTGKVDCKNEIYCNIKFSKASINLCKSCAVELYEKLAQSLVPKSLKSKFYMQK